jgi:transcriptional regulator with XRE-family HTH domain
MGNIGREERFARLWEQRFGARVREIRQARGWTQDDLAKRMTSAGYQMHQTTLTKLENGSRPTSVGEAAALAAIFGIPMPYLFATMGAADLRVQLAGLSHTLDTISEERIKIRERLATLEAEEESVKALYRATERRARELEHDERMTSGQHQEES